MKTTYKVFKNGRFSHSLYCFADVVGEINYFKGLSLNEPEMISYISNELGYPINEPLDIYLHNGSNGEMRIYDIEWNNH